MIKLLDKVQLKSQKNFFVKKNMFNFKYTNFAALPPPLSFSLSLPSSLPLSHSLSLSLSLLMKMKHSVSKSCIFYK